MPCGREKPPHLHGVYSPISLLYKQPRAAPNDVQIPYTMVSVGVFFIMNRGTGIVAIETIIEEREHIHLATMPLLYESEYFGISYNPRHHF